jgi:hypothetical protein
MGHPVLSVTAKMAANYGSGGVGDSLTCACWRP